MPVQQMALLVTVTSVMFFFISVGISQSAQRADPTVADNSFKGVCEVHNIDFRNFTETTFTLVGNETHDCQVQISTSSGGLFELTIVHANVTKLNYFYIDMMDSSPNRYLIFSGQIKKCAIVLEASDIVLHIRSDSLVQVRKSSPTTFNEASSHWTAEEEGSCGEMKHYEKIIECDAKYKEYYTILGVQAHCKLSCPPDCSCELLQDEVRYRCANGAAGAFYVTFPPESNLEFIDLSWNGLTDLGTDAFQKWHWVTVLWLDYNNLTQLRDGVFQRMEFVLQLDLTQNAIKTIEPNVFQDMIRLRLLYLKGNQLLKLDGNTFRGLKYLQILNLKFNKLKLLSREVFRDQGHMMMLDLSDNNLSELQRGVFQNLTRLRWLYLGHNFLATLPTNVFHSQRMLKVLQLHNNSLTTLESTLFKNASNLNLLTIDNNRLNWINPSIWYELPSLTQLNISQNSLYDLRRHSFDNISNLAWLDLRFNRLRKVDAASFDGFDNSTTLYVDDSPACCFAKTTVCISVNPIPPFTTCERLMPYAVLRFFMWVLGFAALIGNASVIIWRCKKRKDSKVQPVQRSIIINLAVSDFLMGLYMIIIIAADTHFGVYFPLYSEEWRTSSTCKFAGILSITSSEASVFFVTLISIDRFLGVLFPFKQYRISQRKVAVIITLMWIVAFSLGMIPTLLSGSNSKFYKISQTCIGLPFVRQPIYTHENIPFIKDWTADLAASFQLNREGTFRVSKVSGSSSWMYFSIAIFLGLNFMCCIIIFLCYLSIFLTVRKTTVHVGRYQERQSEELRMAFKMAVIVLTDFFCWMPIIIIGILVQTHAITLSPLVYAWIAVFILPINSAVNPFLYTLVTAFVDRFDPKRRSSSYGSVPFKMSNTRRTTLNSTSKEVSIGMNGIKEEPV